MRRFLLAIVVVLFAAATAVFAQSSGDSPSLGDVARANRNTPKKASTRIVTDDDIRKPAAAESKQSEAKPAKPAKDEQAPAVEGEDDEDQLAKEEPKRSENKTQAKEAAAERSDNAEAKAAIAREWKSKISAQRQTIDGLERDISVSDREHRLRASSYYSDAGNRLRDERKWVDDEKKYAADMDLKKQQLSKAKEALDQMISAARAAGVQGID